ncbi:helix-turn-helix domain-containing protein [Nonomuraea sp. NPDC049504]|uniref:helix-turn-helix domain-containing protein n=1 Tax=Nonomuraea sp. NPDC049504 TaxID=3154729 RepID=UPI00344781DC
MANTSDTSGSRRDAVRALRSGIGRISDELTAEIQARIPEYARPSDELCTKVVRTAVEQAVEGFVDRVERPGAAWDPEPFRQIGRAEAAEGRTLEPLQSALRLGARVGWRRLTDLGLPPECLHDLGETVFTYLDDLAQAATEGYETAKAHGPDALTRHRAYLLNLLLNDPSPSPEALSTAAQAAAWPLPTTVTCIALAPTHPTATSTAPFAARSSGNAATASQARFAGPDATGSAPFPPHQKDGHPRRRDVLVRWAACGGLPADVLVGLERGVPCLLVPEPEGKGEVIERVLRGCRAAVGPAVPPMAAGTSLRWASEALELSRRGVLPGGLLRCADHMATLVLFKDEELVRALAQARLAPLAHLRPAQQDRLAETLLAWLRHGRGAGEVAATLHVHPQTVRYRLRQLEELYGDQLADPDIRFELEIALRARQAATPAR